MILEKHMLSVTLKNVCREYQVFLDGKELSLSISNDEGRYSSPDVLSGEHTLKITKQFGNVNFLELLSFWLLALVSSNSNNSMTSLYRSAVELEIEFSVNVDHDLQFVFDTYTNKVLASSAEYKVIRESRTQNKKLQAKVNRCLKLPIFLLTVLIAVPLWVLSILAIVDSIDLVSAGLFIMSSLLLMMCLIAVVRNVKNKW